MSVLHLFFISLFAVELVDIVNSFTELITLLKFWTFIGKIWTYSVESKTFGQSTMPFFHAMLLQFHTYLQFLYETFHLCK